MQPRKMRKPAAGKATGLQNIEMLPSKIDSTDDTLSASAGRLQARRLRRQFEVSWALARAIAEHVFGRPL